MAKHFFGLTDTGKVRDNNEDSFIVAPIDSDEYIIAAVIDGVGGYHGGEVAADIAKQEIGRQFSFRPEDPISQMIKAFRETNKLIATKKQTEKELAEMACVATLVLADLANNQFYYAHVGDTRLYLLRDGSLVKISKDHSFVGFLEDSGRLDEAAAMQHPKRNELNKAIGFDDQINTDESYIETGQSPFLPGDILLLCSDGLTDMVNKEDITSLLLQGDTLAKKAGNLVALANENGGLDNITVVLVQNNNSKLNVVPTRPVSAQQVSPSISTVSNEAPVTEIPTKVNREGKKHPGLIALIILCVILLGTTLLLFFKTPRTEDTGSLKDKPTKILVRNTQEKLLQDAIDHSPSDTLVLSDTVFKSPIILSDTIKIKKDTLYVFANGIVLQADSSYKGPAIVLKSDAKLIGLDSIQFNGFNNAISVSNQTLFLKNVRFINCVTHVFNSYVFPNQQLINMAFPKASEPKIISKKESESKNGAN
ncbi:MAG: serine/threonine-protein phosphatase [Flavobacterium sp.]|nr:MAG: serine/threonine-protein phosphatase [Flavobacterium sp.]